MRVPIPSLLINSGLTRDVDSFGAVSSARAPNLWRAAVAVMIAEGKCGGSAWPSSQAARAVDATLHSAAAEPQK